MPRKPDDVIQEIIKLLFDEGAHNWAIQDKGALLAAVKLGLSENLRNGQSNRQAAQEN